MKTRAVCLLLILLLLPGGALASPGLTEFRCTLTPTLDAKGVLGAPFDRWASELFEMTTPVVRYAEWPEGQALSIEVLANGALALTLNLISEGERVGMSTSLMGDGWTLLTGDQALDALRLMDNAKLLLSPEAEWALSDCTLHLSAGRAAEQLNWNSGMLNRWSDGVGEALKDTSEAMVLAFTLAAEMVAAKPDGAPLLDVFVHYEAPDFVPGELDKDAQSAPEGLLMALVCQVPEVMVRTIANSEDE